MTRWNLQNLLEDKSLLQTDKKCEKINAEQTGLNFLYSNKDLDKKVEQFEKNLSKFLNSHAKITKITAYSKQCQNKKVA